MEVKSPYAIVLAETEQQRAFRNLQYWVNHILLHHIIPRLYSPDWANFFMPSERERLIRILEKSGEMVERP